MTPICTELFSPKFIIELVILSRSMPSALRRESMKVWVLMMRSSMPSLLYLFQYSLSFIVLFSLTLMSAPLKTLLSIASLIFMSLMKLFPTPMSSHCPDCESPPNTKLFPDIPKDKSVRLVFSCFGNQMVSLIFSYE